MSDEILDIATLKKRITQFIAERHWQKFQTPKNIAMALTVESAELLEIFQWLTEEESFALRDSEKLTHVTEEVADIIVYTISLCTLLNIDIAAAIERKLAMNEQKYPLPS